MKKLFIGLICLGLFWQSANCSDVYDTKSFNKNLVRYNYNSKYGKCLPTDPGKQDLITHSIRSGELEVTDMYEAIPGVITTVILYNGTGYNELIFASTYGVCLMYIDDMIKNIDNIEPEHYVDLQYSK